MNTNYKQKKKQSFSQMPKFKYKWRWLEKEYIVLSHLAKLI